MQYHNVTLQSTQNSFTLSKLSLQRHINFSVNTVSLTWFPSSNVKLHLFATLFPIYFLASFTSCTSREKKWFGTPHYHRKQHSENIALAGTRGVVPITSRPLSLVQLAASTCEFVLAGYRGYCAKLSEPCWLWPIGVMKNNIHIKLAVLHTHCHSS